MADRVGLAVLRVLGSVASRFETASEIEEAINDQLGGKPFTFSNYKGEETTITVESVTVRPKYSPMEKSSGIQQIEADNIFSGLDSERSEPSFSERLKAILTDNWITYVRFDIEGGDADAVRPSGLGLHYVSALDSLHFRDQFDDDDPTPVFPAPAIRVSNSNEIQPDKLEMKLRYDGSLGQYRRKLHNGVDILKNIQDMMDGYVIKYLIELYHSGKIESTDSFEWPRPKRVRKLGEYLLGEPVDLDALAVTIEEIMTDIEEGRNVDSMRNSIE